MNLAKNLHKYFRYRFLDISKNKEESKRVKRHKTAMVQGCKIRVIYSLGTVFNIGGRV